MESTGSHSVKERKISFENYPVREGSLTEMEYTLAETRFSLWSPMADRVKVLLYDSGHEGIAYCTHFMTKCDDGSWKVNVSGNLLGKFYTFNVKYRGRWLGETPGIMAKAVGVNGKRGAIIDMASTNPDEWNQDERPLLKSFADIVIYEMHHRDFSIHKNIFEFFMRKNLLHKFLCFCADFVLNG